MNKKIYLFPAAALLAAIASSCSEDRPDNPGVPDSAEYISFSSPAVSFDGEGRTRAASAAYFGDGGIGEFTVWGYCVPYLISSETLNYEGAAGDWNTKSALCAPTLFGTGYTGTTVKVSGARAEYTPLKEWIVNNGDLAASYNYTYSFIAAANGKGADGAGGFTMLAGTQNNHTPRLRFTMPFEDGNLDMPRDRGNISDALVASTFDRTRRMGKIDLDFSHILTGIRFRVNNKTGRELVVTSLTLSGQFYREAEFSFATDRMATATVPLSESSYSGTFTVFSGTQTVPDNGSSLLGKTEENPEGDMLLLLPNPAPGASEHPLGANKRITVKYTVGGEVRQPFNIDILRLNYNPRPNTRHTANLTFVDDNIVLVFQADNQTNWENGSDNNIDIH